MSRPVHPDYVIYGASPWDSPWLTEQNLANALAASHRVLYVEPPVSPLTPLRYGLGRGPARLPLRRLRSEGRVHVLTPATLPPREHPRARAAARPLLRAQVGRAVDRLGLAAPVVVAARAVLDLLGAARESLRVYLVKDLAEAGAAMLGKDSEVVARQMADMCARADVVVAVTAALRDTLANRGVRSELLPHGFHSELAEVYDSASRPAEYERLPSPRLGYTGRIDARLDFEALEHLAERFAHGSVVLVGPVSPLLADEAFERLARRPNVHLLGARSREELPGYVRHLDCCLMPYRDDEWLRHGSPLKLWDYLYAGPPLVGSGCAALRSYPLVSFAESGADLPELVERALSDGGAERAERRAFALENTWDRRAVEFDEIVERALAGGGALLAASG